MVGASPIHQGCRFNPGRHMKEPTDGCVKKWDTLTFFSLSKINLYMYVSLHRMLPSPPPTQNSWSQKLGPKIGISGFQVMLLAGDLSENRSPGTQECFQGFSESQALLATLTLNVHSVQGQWQLQFPRWLCHWALSAQDRALWTPRLM